MNTQKKIKNTLFTTTVRSLLEYASVVWQTWYKKANDLLENVQRHCMSLCYDPPQLESLEQRRSNVDLVETILRNKYCINSDSLFTSPNKDLKT